MKSFSKVLSVLVLSLFCSFFVGNDVCAATSGAQTVTVADKTLSYTVRNYYYNYLSSSMAAFTRETDVGAYFRLLDIPGTVVGQEYVVTVRLRNLRSSPASGVSIFTYQYLSFATNSTFDNSVLVGGDEVKVSDSGVVEFKVDALDGSTPVYIFYSNLYDVDIFQTAKANFSFPAIPAGSMGTSNNSYVFSVDASDISYALQVGGDDLLDEMKHQTDVIQDGMDQVNGSLTTFPGSGDMDASKGQLDTAIGDYDQIEGSLFDSSKAAFDQFDPSSLFNFTVGIYSAIAVLSDLMIETIAMMGEFSVLYTVSAAMIFFGMLIGLWRYFKK